jgi:long-chain acyl-CoA synthetase
MNPTLVTEWRRAVQRFAPRVAIVTEDAVLTYHELYSRAVRLASALAALGVCPSDRVTLYGINGLDWIISYYGTLLAGAVVNPVNAMLTAEEASFIVRDCGATVVIGSGDKVEPLLELKSDGAVRHVIAFGYDAARDMLALDELLERGSGHDAEASIECPTTCCIGYTSGTTGHPKGAVQSHRNVLMNAKLTGLMHARSESDVVVSALPLPHVYGNVILNSTLLSGGKLVLHARFDAAAILASIAEQRATLFEGVPTMYYYLLECDQLTRTDLSTLRMCTVGGQTMPVAAMERVEQHFGCPLIELWGMTELAGLGTTFMFGGPRQLGSIGVPLPYCQVKVVDLDNSSRSLSAGEAGELLIRGPLVMQGYYGHEEATGEAIEPDGWLHTGDVARIDDDGFIYVVDRKKDVIVSAGYNVYPAEVERVLAAHPAVAMAAVGGVANPLKGEVPKAYVVLRSGSSTDADELLGFCRTRLAGYKVPREVQFVRELPRTGSGKILRRRLRELDRDPVPEVSTDPAVSPQKGPPSCHRSSS